MQREEPILVRHTVSGFSDAWVIPEVDVPESALHDACLRLLWAILDAWILRTQRDAAVYRDVAVRVRRDRPQVGFDPDISLVAPAPPDAATLESLCLWKNGHSPPLLAIEVVSRNHPYKDYAESPDKCAAAGVSELVVFDPLRVGPKAGGGPRLLQVWQRSSNGTFDRVYAGDGPFRSSVLDAFWVPSAGGERLRLAARADGASPWPTSEETASAAAEALRSTADAALAAERTALERVAALQAEVERLKNERQG